MNFITQECNGNPLGIRTSQLVTRNYADFGNKRPLESETDNINRFLAAHSHINESQKWKKQSRYNVGYLARDARSKSSSAHQFLCGPLNTNRLTKKSHSYIFDTPSTPQFSNFHHLYGNSNESCKTPWNNPSPNPNDIRSNFSNQNAFNKTSSFDEHTQISTNIPPITSANTTTKSSDSGASDMVLNFSPSLVHNLVPYLKHAENVRISVKKRVLSIPPPHQNIPDGQVPDSVRGDAQNSCPLYDSSEYEQIDVTEEQNKPTVSQISDDDVLSPESSRSRYRFYIGEELPSFIFNDTEPTKPLKSTKKQYHTTVNKISYSKPRAREDVLIPLLTWPDGRDILITEYKPFK